MKRMFCILVVCSLFQTACSPQPAAGPTDPATAKSGPSPPPSVTPTAAPAPEPQNRTPVPVAGEQVALSPANSKFEFIGVHLPPKAPDPRTGGFEKFSGTAKVDTAKKSLASVQLEIDTTSLWTEIGGRLTDHLKSADFLEVREYPTIKFESAKIEPGSGNQCQITGPLTMHGVTKEISFPATVEISEAGITLVSTFRVQRQDFGINFGPNQVGNEVEINAVIGEKTQVRQGGGGFGGKGKGKRKGTGQPGGAAPDAAQPTSGDKAP